MTHTIQNYSGNVIITSISFDSLAEMFEDSPGDYDPKDANLYKTYVGKVGKYVEGSYFWNSYWNTATVLVEFLNGYQLLVCVNDVAQTNQSRTREEFLPKVTSKDDNSNYRKLTANEIEFADKALLAMLSTAGDVPADELKSMLNGAVTLAMYRTEAYSCVWEKTQMID